MEKAAEIRRALKKSPQYWGWKKAVKNLIWRSENRLYESGICCSDLWGKEKGLFMIYDTTPFFSPI